MDKNVQPVQSDLLTFLSKKLWRLERLFPGDCMDDVIKGVDKLWVAFAKPVIARVCVAGPTGLESAAP